jgi:hypothetical protein
MAGDGIVPPLSRRRLLAAASLAPAALAVSAAPAAPTAPAGSGRTMTEDPPAPAGAARLPRTLQHVRDGLERGLHVGAQCHVSLDGKKRASWFIGPRPPAAGTTTRLSGSPPGRIAPGAP